MYRFLTILWLFLGVYTEGVAQGSRYSDSLVLVKFDSAFNHTTLWNLRNPISTWNGIYTNASGRVIRISINSGNLRGQLVSEIGDLSELISLGLNSEGIVGVFPPSIGKLSNLDDINLTGCKLTGPIPPEIGNLRRLTYLSFWNNRFTGNIPPQIGNLTALRNLDLCCNNLTGSIPPTIGLLTNVAYLVFSDNKLSGSIPKELGRLTGLGVLGLSNNELTGELPVELGNMQSLFGFYVDRNKLTGAVPTSLINLKELCTLDISNNQFTDFPDLARDSFKIYWIGRKLNISNNKLSFKHILINLRIARTTPPTPYHYAPQDSVYIDTIIFANINETVTIDLKIDDTVQTNIYKWFKNEQFYQTTTVNKLILRSGRICPADTFRCEITNPNAPDLTLYSRHIVINYLGLKAITNNQNICKGDTYRLPNGREVSKEGIYVDTLKAQGGCDSAVVTTILKFFEKPTAQHDPFDLPNDSPFIEIDPLINDNFRSNPLFRRLDSPKYGQLDSLPNNHFRYTRLPFLTGDVSFRYAICDRICPSVCDTATVTIHINDFEARNKIGITPSNRDGINDALVFDLLENDPQRFGNAKLLIFNLLGQVIYQQQPYDNKWMGTFQNGQDPVPKGAYLFLLILNDKNKDREQICGSVTVIREN